MNPLAALLRRAAGDPRPDGELLAAFLADRDEAAFAEVVRRHAGLVWGVCRRTLPDPADAEDAFQATFLVLVRRAGRLTRAATVGPWLHRVAAWTARSLRRKNARRLSRRRELPAAVPAPAAPDPPCDLDALLLRLPERYRAALVLCHLGGLTHREAAARLGCAEGTVSSLVSRGLAKLRAKLAADPTPLLLAALAGAAPASLSAAAVKSAVALQLASLSAAASPAVASLVKGVLPMFWVKKATAAGMMALVLVTTGVGVGVSVRQVPQAVAQADTPAKPIVPPVPVDQDIEALRARITRLQNLREMTEKELASVRATLQVAEAKRRQIRAVGKEEFELIVGSAKAQHPYSFIERAANGDVELSVYAPTEAGVRRHLARMRADPKAPKGLVISVARNAPDDRLRAAVYAAKAAGYGRIRLVGYVPVGADYLSHGSVAMQFSTVDELNIDLANVPEPPQKPRK